MSEDKYRPWPPEDDQSGANAWEEGYAAEGSAGDEGLYDSSGAILQDEELDGEGGGLLSGVPRIALVIAAALIVLILVVVVVRALLPGAEPAPTPTVVPTATVAPALLPTFTPTLVAEAITTTVDTPPAEVEIVEEATPEPSTATLVPGGKLAVGGTVRIKGTEGEGLRLRANPTTKAATLIVLQDGDVLKVVGGPRKADGFNWWRLEASDGTVGWTIARHLQSVVEQ